MSKRMSIMLVCLAIFFGILIGWRMFVNSMIKKVFSQPMPAISVSTMKVQGQSWHPYLESTASLKAQQVVDIMPQVPGIVTKIYFQSGDVVKAGAPLLDLDDSVELANLESDKAKVKLSEAKYQRAKKLLPEGIVSKSDYDTAVATLAQDKASVARDQVLITQKHITAPFSGKLGIRQINLGEYISLGRTTPIVNLQMLDPLEVEFSLTQQDVAQLKIGQEIIYTVDAFSGKEFKGKITATNAGFNADSRMLLVRAVLPNMTQELYPGMYGTVKILLPVIENMITVPQTAVEYNLYGNIMYVVKKNADKILAKQISVTLGQRRQDEVAILKGLQVGDEIVTVGQIKLFDNAPIKIEPDRSMSLAK